VVDGAVRSDARKRILATEGRCPKCGRTAYIHYKQIRMYMCLFYLDCGFTYEY
jgi:ssDNA-binding Zn-finger/Zn-ribbon topoisomerase 1